MSLDVFYRVVLQDKFSAVASKLKSNFSKLQQQISLIPTAMGVGFLNMQKHMQNFESRSTRTGLALTAAFTVPLMLAGKHAMRAYQEMQTLNVAFSTMLHSQVKGAKLMSDLRGFAKKSIFTFTDIANSAKALMGAQIPVNLIKKDLSMLGDVAAGVGKPLSAIAPEFAKIKMEGHVYMRDILTMSAQGIPIMAELKKHLHMVGQAGTMTSKQFMQAVASGAITFKMLEKTLKEMTGKHGQFYRQMFAHSRTYLASENKLTEGIGLFNAALGAQLDSVLGLSSGMRSLGMWFNRISEKIGPMMQKHKLLTKTIVYLLGALVGLGPGILILMKTYKIIKLLFSPIGMLAKSFVWLGRKAVAAFSDIFASETLALSPILGISVAIVGIVAAAYELYQYWDAIAKKLEKVWYYIQKVNIFKNIGTPSHATALKEGLYQQITHHFKATAAPAVAPSSPIAKGRADIHITVDDKSGKVANIQTYSKGDHHFTLGHNMVHHGVS